jgi:hypothetical protein
MKIFEVRIYSVEAGVKHLLFSTGKQGDSDFARRPCPVGAA